MAQAKGSASRLVFDFEASYKTAKAKAVRAPIVLPFNSCDVKGGRALNQSKTLRGDRNPVDPYQGNLEVGGSLTVPVDMNVMGYLLKAAIGLPTTTDNQDGTYTHVFKIDPTADLPSFVLEKGFPDLATPYYQLYGGCKVNSLELKVGGDGELLATVNILGATNANGSVPYDDPTVSDALAQAIFTERFQQFEAAMKEGGSASSVMTAFSLALSNNLDNSSFVIGGGGVRSELPEGIAGVSGTVTALFRDTTILEKAKSNTKSSLQVTWTRGDSVLDLLFPEVKFKESDPGVSGPAGVTIELPFEGFKATGESAVVATLTCARAEFA